MSGDVIQVIKTYLDSNNKIRFELCLDQLVRWLRPIEDKEVVVISVVGPTQTAKSFILNLIGHKLSNKTNDELITGFESKTSVDPITTGLWLSKPIILKQDNEKEVAVLLMDCQSLFDINTNAEDLNAMIRTYPYLLLSSYIVFNVNSSMSQELLKIIEPFLQNMDEDSDCAHNLIFLIRDWNRSSGHEFGREGGHHFIQNLFNNLTIEVMRENFKSFECYLMPNAFTREEEFNGFIDSLNSDFLVSLNELLTHSLKANELIPIIKDNVCITGKGLLLLFKEFIDCFNDNIDYMIINLTNNEYLEEESVEDSDEDTDVYMEGVSEESSEEDIEMFDFKTGHSSQTESTERKEITILLLGETGVGKSTFINALINYLFYDTLDEASKHPICLIPTNFYCSGLKSKKRVKVTFGSPDLNESITFTESSTQSCRCYDFNLEEKYSIKIIDTPGIGDTRGLEADKRNLQQLLYFLSNYKELNAICILLKPNNARIGIVFKYCILELLSQLNKTASNNIIFCFTNCRGTLYEPGDSAEAVTEILNEVKSRPPNIDIKFDQNNSFCFDNETFRYLAAISEPNNVFEDNIKKNYEKSWKVSVNECHRMFRYINELKPHLIQDTISINDVRRNIILLAKPMTDISNHILREIEVCKQHKQKIKEFKGSIKELRGELYIPSYDVISYSLKRPKTVCADKSCCEEKAIQGVTKTHYKKTCHKPCYLDNSDGNIIGNKGLLNCKAFNSFKMIKGTRDWYEPGVFVPDSNLETNDKGLIYGHLVNQKKSEICNVCKHSFQTHLTINYETKYMKTKIRDENKMKEIETKEQIIEDKEKTINNIETKILELEKELQYITQSSAYFALFLKKNALIPLNDSLEGYLQLMIYNQRTGISLEEGNTTLKRLEEMLISYRKEKEILEKAMNMKSPSTNTLDPSEIQNRISKLTHLKHYGNVIKQNLRIQQSSQREFHSNAKEIKVKLKSSVMTRAKQWFCDVLYTLFGSVNKFK